MYSAFVACGYSRTISSFLRLVEGEKRWKAPDHPQGFSFKIGVKQYPILLSSIWCSKVRQTTGVQSTPLHCEFRGPRSGTADQGAPATTITIHTCRTKAFRDSV
ncbi:hypothetical protein TNCV_2547931 [Trichonephila clavipes]|nr:hypothetical protein TNCV_2547931 [Trichonephila clavipes]